jgi:hypothetical protein
MGHGTDVVRAQRNSTVSQIGLCPLVGVTGARILMSDPGRGEGGAWPRTARTQLIVDGGDDSSP